MDAGKLFCIVELLIMLRELFHRVKSDAAVYAGVCLISVGLTHVTPQGARHFEQPTTILALEL